MDVEKNVGGNERIVRAVLGPVLILVAVAGLAGLLGAEPGIALMVAFVVALVVGLVASVTAYTQECLINQQLGRNTFE